MDILKLAQAEFDYMVKVRRHMHENPECGPEEQVETMAMIERELDSIGVRHLRIPEGGILGFLGDASRGRTVLLRADMDALPIDENPENLAGKKQCVSKRPGVSHACGHDAHIAMQLAEAKILKGMEEELKGAVILVFEQGEEGHGNIEQILRYIQAEQLHIDTVYATHVRWDFVTNKVHVVDGTALAGLYLFKCTLHGVSGHGSRPDLAKSVLDCFVSIYNLLQSVRMDHVGPDKLLTFSVGEIHAGTACNVIPDLLEFQGTTRFFERESGQIFWRELKRILETACGYYGCTYELECTHALLPTVNNCNCRELWRESIVKYIGEEYLGECEPWMASESYSYLLGMYPGVMSFTGIRNFRIGSGANHHTPEFDLDEQGMPLGAAGAIAYTLGYLENPPDTSRFKPLCESMEDIIRLNHEI